VIPTIGRIVIVQGYADGVKLGQPSAAIVILVHSPTVVDLHVFKAYGGTDHITSAGLDEGQAIDGWYWSWPPRV
jgi:hypothetical protein